MELEKVNAELVEQRNLLADKTKEFEAKIEARDVESAKSIKEELEAIQSRIDELNEKVASFEVEEEPEEKIVSDDEVEESEERNLNDKGESEQMEKRQIIEEEENTEVRAFNSYLETRDIEEDGLKTDEGYVVVPEEESKSIIELADDIVKLKNFVTVKKVSTPAGSQPVRTTAKAKLSTVEELAKSPEIGVTPFTEVDYKIETKRGYIPYSEEYRQDGVNLEGDLKQFIGEVVTNTENDDILSELDTVRSETVESVDALKTLVNTGFSAGKSNRIKFIVSQSVFDNLDRVKDNNGRYLLQESIANETGYRLLGKDVVVLDDEYFPDETTAFVGDLKEIVYFDRSQVRVQWTNYLHFGQCLGVAIRNDVGKVEDEETKVNIYKVTIDIPTDKNDTP